MRWPTVAKLARGVRAGEVEPLEHAARSLREVEARDGDLRSFLAVADDPDAPEGIGQGTLAGVPIALKDNLPTRDLPTTYASRFEPVHGPQVDHVAAARLRDAGAVIVGKTNLSEFAILPVTSNAMGEGTANPVDPARSPGGSSGGSAAAVAAGLVPVALGTDAGGSVRVPAAFCGVLGVKPSFGRVPDAPRLPVLDDRSSVGVLARRVEDAARVLDVLAGPHPADPRSLPAPEVRYVDAVRGGRGDLRVAFAPTFGGRPVDPGVTSVVEQAVGDLHQGDVTVEEVAVELPDVADLLGLQSGAELRAWLGDRVDAWREVAHPPVRALADLSVDEGAATLARASGARIDLWEALRPVFREHDVLATPATAVPAFPRGSLGPDEVDREAVGPLGWMPFTYPFNFTGQPAASVPAGRTSRGLPVGLQLVGPPRGDDVVLEASAQLERVRPWVEG